MGVFPQLRQWRNWSLPSKLTAIGTYVSVAGLLVTLALTAFDKLADRASEDVVLKWVRANDNYGTVYSRRYSYRAAISEPASIQAMWDLTVINNGRLDASIIDYQIDPTVSAPLRRNGEIVDVSTGEPIRLPIVVVAGHAALIRVRGYLEVPGDVAFEIARRYGDVDDKVHTIRDLLTLLVALKIDLFGNQLVFGGPDSPYIGKELPLRDQHVTVVLRTGRGASVGADLWWYGPKVEPRFWGPQQPKPERD